KKKMSEAKETKNGTMAKIIDADKEEEMQCSDYDVRFFSQLPQLETLGLICSICKNVIQHVVETKCGHLFCHGCLQQSLLSKEECPICRRRLEGSLASPPSASYDRIVENAPVHCYYSDECKWTGAHHALHRHRQ